MEARRTREALRVRTAARALNRVAVTIPEVVTTTLVGVTTATTTVMMVSTRINRKEVTHEEASH